MLTVFGRARDSPLRKTWLRPVSLNAFTEQVCLQLTSAKVRLIYFVEHKDSDCGKPMTNTRQYSLTSIS